MVNFEGAKKQVCNQLLAMVLVQDTGKQISGAEVSKLIKMLLGLEELVVAPVEEVKVE